MSVNYDWKLYHVYAKEDIGTSNYRPVVAENIHKAVEEYVKQFESSYEHIAKIEKVDEAIIVQGKGR